MKPCAYLSIILALVLAFGACKSNRNLSTSRVEEKKEQITEQGTTTERIDSTSTSMVDQTIVENTTSSKQTDADTEKETESDEYERERTKATIYDEHGNIKAVIESERERGRADKTAERGRTSETSSGSTASDTKLEGKRESSSSSDRSGDQTKISKSETNSDEQTNLNENSDSRWIQGWEWLAVIVPISIIVAITYLIRNGRNKKD